MIDPYNIRTPASTTEAQELLVFIICTANATAHVVAPRVDKLLGRTTDGPPFYSLRVTDVVDGLEQALREEGIGCSGMKARHLRAVMNEDWFSLLRLRHLERLVGPKSARMWLLWVHPGRDDVAVLDRHQLAWLRSRGYPGAPASTPPRGWAYLKWEMAYIAECRRAGVTVRHMDQEVWRVRARRSREHLPGAADR